MRVGYGPDIVVEAPETADGVKRVECYPYSLTSESLRYLYWKDIPAIDPSDPLPPRLRQYALKEGVLIDVYRYLMAQAAQNNNVTKAAFWGNLQQRQETLWDRYLRELVKADRHIRLATVAV